MGDLNANVHAKRCRRPYRRAERWGGHVDAADQRAWRRLGCENARRVDRTRVRLEMRSRNQERDADVEAVRENARRMMVIRKGVSQKRVNAARICTHA